MLLFCHSQIYPKRNMNLLMILPLAVLLALLLIGGVELNPVCIAQLSQRPLSATYDINACIHNQVTSSSTALQQLVPSPHIPSILLSNISPYFTVKQDILILLLWIVFHAQPSVEVSSAHSSQHPSGFMFRMFTVILIVVLL